jgi:hypothetical protein
MPKKKKLSSTSEDRFAAAETRPQFRTHSTKQSKVVLDERFSSVLTDPRFQLQPKDKYGRTNKNKKNEAIKEELSAFYTIQENNEEPKDANEQPKNDDAKNKRDDDDQKEKSSNSEQEDDEEPEDPASRIAYLTKLSRGELDMSSSSEDDDSSKSSDNDDDDDDSVERGQGMVNGSAGILDPSTRAEEEEEISISYEDSPYLVATNLDWVNLRAVDIFTILSSFTSPGALKRVQVYQSDFGKERMEKDKLGGPADIWKRKKIQAKTRHDDDNEDTASESMEDAADGGNEPEEDPAFDDSNAEEKEEEEEEADEDDEALENEDDEVVYDESEFDAEKLRAYEASKLKYFFAIVEFAKPEHANIAYREVDGMEFEHSSSAIDLRTLPPEALEDVIKDRAMRDEATSIPSNYEPPDFVVSALQQTNVQCTWDQGDTERERKLTNHFNGAWQGLAEADDVKAYLASDASSDDESEDERAAKGSQMRKLLGLDSGSEDDGSASDRRSSDPSDDDSDNNSDGEEGKTLKFIPGAKKLEEKIRNKLEAQDEEEELTPWQKYLEKRKQKRRERKQAMKKGGKEAEASKQGHQQGMLHDDVSEEEDERDDFFMDDGDKKPSTKRNLGEKTVEKFSSSSRSSRHELELLLAGENEEEEARDYDIRGIQRIEKNKGKKLQGSRKRKEEILSEDVSGKDFKVDVQDSRFAAVLEGSDDRFGIDKTDPHFKDTPAMQRILSEQTERRKKKQKKSNSKSSTGPVAPNIDVEKNAKSAGANALSALVQKLKTQVS